VVKFSKSADTCDKVRSGNGGGHSTIGVKGKEGECVLSCVRVHALILRAFYGTGKVYLFLSLLRVRENATELGMEMVGGTEQGGSRVKKASASYHTRSRTS
jgi:hypothetical protein